MAECKECLYYEVCPLGLAIKGSTGACLKFKNKADVEEVVRCPECIYCENMKCTELRDNSAHPLDVAIFDHCSRGVRR